MTATATPTTRRPSANRDIPVRRLGVDPSTLPDDGWLVDGDPIFSHFLATLSAVFPQGEEFFVTSVRRHRDAVGDDAVLRSQVNAFIGQEAMHGREHRALNARLAELGYGTLRADATIKGACDRILRFRPTTIAVAATAAAEHLTGVFAESVLGDDRTRHLLFAQPEIEPLICWHAVEELEHKNVAFDVLERTGSGYVVRVAGFVVTASVLATAVVWEWGRSVVAMHPDITWAHRRRFVRNLGRQRLLSLWSLAKVLGYLRPGFHPDDTDTDALVAEWRERIAATTTTRAVTT